MPNLQPLLDELGVVLEQEEDCPHVEDRWAEVCCHCHGTRKAPNRAYDGLREVVRERCTFHSLVENIECICIGGHVSMDGQVHYPCQACGGTGYSPRSWEGKLDGELEGALIKAVGKMVEYPAYMPGMVELFSTLLQLIAQEGDTSEAAVQAVLEALR